MAVAFMVHTVDLLVVLGGGGVFGGVPAFAEGWKKRRCLALSAAMKFTSCNTFLSVKSNIFTVQCIGSCSRLSLGAGDHVSEAISHLLSVRRWFPSI